MLPWKRRKCERRVERSKVCNQTTQNSARIQPTDRTAERKEPRHKNKTYSSCSSRRWYSSLRLLKMRRCMRDEYFSYQIPKNGRSNRDETQSTNRFVNARMWLKCEVGLLMEWDSLAELLGKQQQQHLKTNPLAKAITQLLTVHAAHCPHPTTHTFL